MNIFFYLMCHNSQSVAFNEHLLGSMSPGCLLECGAGRLAGRWKSAAGSHVKPACPVTEWPRAAHRALRPPIPGRQKITRPSSSIGAGGERIPKVVLPPLAPRTPTIFFNYRAGTHMLPASVCGLWRWSALLNFS